MFAPRLTLSALLPLSVSLALVFTLSSCKTKDTALTSDPYVSSEEGSYRPYPGAGGAPSSDSLLPQETASSSYVPQYEQAVPQPPPAYSAPSSAAAAPTYQSAPKKTTPTYTKPKPTYTKPKVVAKSKSSSTKSRPKVVAKTAKKPTTKKVTKPVAKVHTIQKGDTLSALAQKNKTTVAKLKAANGMSSDKLAVGKKLRIP
jgi:LysM repeat protein